MGEWLASVSGAAPQNEGRGVGMRPEREPRPGQVGLCPGEGFGPFSEWDEESLKG